MMWVARWWTAFSSKWNWDEPSLILTALGVVVTGLIPVLIWRLGSGQAARDSKVHHEQAASLARQEGILRRQRRDALLSAIDASTDMTHLSLLWEEIQEFAPKEGQLLKAAFRANVHVALPGSHLGGLKVTDTLDDQAIRDYVAGLERRYTTKEGGFHPYEGLLDFVRAAQSRGELLDTHAIALLVTGPTVAIQKPGHPFYRELVNTVPEAAAELLTRIESLDYRESGGSRLNILTGTLLAVKDAALGRTGPYGAAPQKAVAVLRSSVPVALATLLHRDNLRSLDRWSTEDSTEPVSATIAWLIRVVGWLSDVDDHLAMRMVPNLTDAIRSIPVADRRWGIDDRDVREGFDMIAAKQPGLWAEYGDQLEVAADTVGEWR